MSLFSDLLVLIYKISLQPKYDHNLENVSSFWKQNRPGTVVGPLDVVVHQKTGTIFFTARIANQIMCNLHCPSMITSVAGESRPGSRDGKNSLLHHPSGMRIYENLLFVCDCSNASIRVVDISRLVSRRREDAVLDELLDPESDHQEDAIPLTGKFTVTSSLKVVYTYATQLRKPFCICTGRKLWIIPICMLGTLNKEHFLS